MLVLGAVLAAPQLPILVLLIGKAQRDGAERHDAWCRQLGIQMSAGDCKQKTPPTALTRCVCGRGGAGLVGVVWKEVVEDKDRKLDYIQHLQSGRKQKQIGFSAHTRTTTGEASNAGQGSG